MKNTITTTNEPTADFGKFTADEIKNLKIKHGKRLRYLLVKTEDGDSEFIIKKPSRATSEAVAHAFDKKDNSLAANIMISNCVIAGDTDDIEEDAEVYTKVTTFISALVNDAEIEVKKL